MSRIVHDECTFLHDFIDVGIDIGIAVACSGLLHGVAVPIDALVVIIRKFLLRVGQHVFGILHVDVGLVVITHQANGVLPRSSISVGHVVDEFVNYILSISLSRNRQTTYTAVGHFLQRGDTFSVGEQSEILFQYIGVGVRPGVVGLVGKQVVVLEFRGESVGDEAVVPHAVAEQQEIEASFLCTCQWGFFVLLVVEHLHQPTVSRRIRSAR